MNSTFTKQAWLILPLFMSLLAFWPQQDKELYGTVKVINPIIGDVSYVEKFGCLPDQYTDEDLRIQTHLSYVENLLRQKDVSYLPAELQERRIQLLDHLRDYWQGGIFPRNFDYYQTRKPCFIDRNNTICAVGYLVEQTAGRKVAEEINRNHQYDFVFEMEDPAVDAWIATSGLSKTECAMIQPDYGCWYCPPPCPGNKVEACRWSNCEWECKCLQPDQVDAWVAKALPCDTLGGNGNGNGHGKGGNGNGPNSGPDGPQGSQAYSGGGNQTHMGNLLTVFPNAVMDRATFTVHLNQDENLTVQLIDMNGRLVTSLAQGEFESGHHYWKWDATNLGAGLYFVRATAGKEILTAKLLVVE